MIPFNEPVLLKSSLEQIQGIYQTKKFSGDGPFTKKCHDWFEAHLGCPKVFMTTSCTHALEMMAILIDIKPGDEVILPSYTFVSTANAFALRGAKLIFIDVSRDTMNLDADLISAAITMRTKAIVVVHYAGVACEMDTIKKIADEKNLYLLEDAAQGMMSTYKGRPLGTIGQMGTYSFHETKNYHCGEGGLLIINDSKLIAKAEMIREKGTDRSIFFRGEVDKYTWQTLGSSFLPSELNAAFLYGQLMEADTINIKRLSLWNEYYRQLKECSDKGFFELPIIPNDCVHNGHLFYIKIKNLAERTNLIAFLKAKKVMAISHYIPLHSSPAGKIYGHFHGEDRVTTLDSERLLRFPMYYNLSFEDIHYITNSLKDFWGLK